MFPPLPTPGPLILDNPAWGYPSGCAAGSGMARLRVWDAHLPGDRPARLAIVTELGIGATTTNSAERIVAVLARTLPGPLAVLEHWPAAESWEEGEHLDQVTLRPAGRPGHHRIWPTPEANPQHDEYEAWMAAHGHRLLSHDGPPDGPAPWGPHCDHDKCTLAACDGTGRAVRPCRAQPLGCPHCARLTGPAARHRRGRMGP